MAFQLDELLVKLPSWPKLSTQPGPPNLAWLITGKMQNIRREGEREGNREVAGSVYSLRVSRGTWHGSRAQRVTYVTLRSLAALLLLSQRCVQNTRQQQQQEQQQKQQQKLQLQWKCLTQWHNSDSVWGLVARQVESYECGVCSCPARLLQWLIP